MLLNISITTTTNNIAKSLRFLAPFLRSESKSFFRIYNPKKRYTKKFSSSPIVIFIIMQYYYSNILPFETTG